MRTTITSVVAVVVLGLVAGCSQDGAKPAVAPPPEPNGVAKMKPERAMAVARKAMTDLHDAVYESTVLFDYEGERTKVRVTETITQTGCIRETSHKTFGHSWVRIIGRTMWLKANDKAAENMGRTPAQIEIFRGRWLKLDAPPVARGCDLGWMVIPKRYDDLVEPRGRTKVDGRPGRRFGFGGVDAEVVCTIATEGPPIIIGSRVRGPADFFPWLPDDLRYVSTSRLTDTDTGVEVTPPPDRVVIDPAEFLTENA